MIARFFDCIRVGVFRVWLKAQRRKAHADFVQQIADAVPVLGRDFHQRFDPELVEIRHTSLAALVVGLVHGENERQSGLSNLFRDRRVAGDEPFSSINEKHQEVGSGNRALPLLDHQIVERVGAGAVKPTGISELERNSSPRCGHSERISRGASNRGDDRASRADDAIEKGGLPDVRASDQHD